MKGWIILLILVVAGYYLYTNPSIVGKITAFTGAFTGTSETSIADILKNPENYLNKTVAISGLFKMDSFGNMFLSDDQGYILKLDCKEQGRVFQLTNEIQRYKVTGNLKFTESCGEYIPKCQDREYYNITKAEFDELGLTDCTDISVWIQPNIIAISENQTIPSQEEGWTDSPYSYCGTNISIVSSIPAYIGCYVNSTGTYSVLNLKITETRCNPNSVIKNYYFKCTEPMVKIS
jgi:hypothetical protein